MLASIMNEGEKEFTSRIAACLRRKYEIKRDEVDAIIDQAISDGHLVETKRVGAHPGIPLYSLPPTR